MTHPYKSQLLINLKAHYCDPNWRTVTFFNDPREEVLFVLPHTEDIGPVFKNLFEVLKSLPEINYPRERVVISFCYQNGSDYCSQLTNPNNQDEINLALIGYRPQRKIRLEELKSLSLPVDI